MKHWFNEDKSIRLYNGDCESIINRLPKGVVNCVMTSPPYNVSRAKGLKSTDCYGSKYDIYVDMKTDDEYMEWTCELFNKFDEILADNSVVLWNLSYSSEKPWLMNLVISEIIKNTNYTLADTIVWKKKSAIPNNKSHNKLTRICEFVFVLCRKTEFKTFKTNKKAKSYSEVKKQYAYENIFNFVEAKNNDGSTEINKATYSSELCDKLLSVYGIEGGVVLDPFNGTGTTGVSCKTLGLKYIGIELSEGQFDYSVERLK